MASRRIISSAKTMLDKDDDTSAAGLAGHQSDMAPAVPTRVLLKLLAFTFAMIVLPIGSYFVTVDTVFKGNSTFAGATAAVLANMVLVAYVIVAMREDQSDKKESDKQGKKDR